MSRVFVGAALAASVWLFPPAHGAVPVRVVALGYLGAAAGIAAWLRLREAPSRSSRILHAVDAIVAVLVLGLAGPALSWLAVFPIVAAAYRWGFRETVVTGLLVSAPLLASPFGDNDSRSPALFSAARSAGPLVALAVLLGYLSRRENAVRAESILAKAMDRALVARELHDGAIQSLIGMEVHVDVLRRQSEQNGSAMKGDLERLQELLRRETLNLRELMQQMKPLELDPKQLPDFLAETVDRFWRDTGITASFVSNLAGVDLSPRICREVARIAQEALVNVRKHSGARNVVVRLGSGRDRWKLVVDDDGRGFDFEGRLSQSELDASRKGPVIIKERVRAIGGELMIESNPGRGARLEITFPRVA